MDKEADCRGDTIWSISHKPISGASEVEAFIGAAEMGDAFVEIPAGATPTTEILLRECPWPETLAEIFTNRAGRNRYASGDVRAALLCCKTPGPDLALLEKRASSVLARWPLSPSFPLGIAVLLAEIDRPLYYLLANAEGVYVELAYDPRVLREEIGRRGCCVPRRELS